MTRILQPRRNVWSEQPVARAGLLVDGDDYYRAFYAAAQDAERYILLAGWQFDSDACLLRGKDAENAQDPVTLLAFLDDLCERKPDLRIYILAWDFHAVFSLEREWMQELRFNWTTNDRLEFVFDSSHADQGSHHQKFVVIDGRIAFLGGLDLCDHRWDDRGHKDPNPLRISRGAPHKPFHDVQAYLVGNEVSTELAALFACRWRAAGGDAIDLPDPPAPPWSRVPERGLPLATARVSLSRTDPHGSPTKDASCREICDLFLDAVGSAQRLIYVETQYFSSREIGAALAERFRVDSSPLDVVLVLNQHADSFKEEVAVGLAQAKVLADLRAVVQGTRHRLGIYYTVPATEGDAEAERATYIHSKLMIVDDRFLTVGSANLTNRSMCLDTELNVSVETESPGDALSRSIARIRESLIHEHVGVPVVEGEASGLVARLDEHAARREGRLRLHPSPTDRERTVLEIVDPQQLPFDPAKLEDHDDDRSIFVGGLGALWTRLAGSAATPPGE